MRTYKTTIGIVVILFVLVAIPLISFASETDGTIQHQYTWAANTGWVNFGATNGDLHVTDSGLTGYAWDANYGWIHMNPTNGGVLNDGNGNLSGQAWSQGGGWIDFSNVTIDASGIFHGTATGSVYGAINFDCSNCSVTTDWRPQSVRSSGSTSSTSSPISMLLPSSGSVSSSGGTVTLVRQSDGSYLPILVGSTTGQSQTFLQKVTGALTGALSSLFGKPHQSISAAHSYTPSDQTVSSESSSSPVLSFPVHVSNVSISGTTSIEHKTNEAVVSQDLQPKPVHWWVKLWRWISSLI